MHETLKPGYQYRGTPYKQLNCWELVLAVYQDVLGREACLNAARLTSDLCEVWYQGEVPITIQPMDVLLFAMHGHGAHHVALATSSTEMLHSERTHGVGAEPIARYRKFLLQIVRHKTNIRGQVTIPTVRMPPHDRPSDAVTIRYVQTPIRARDGSQHEERWTAPPGTIDALHPGTHPDEHLEVWHNYRLVPADQYGDTHVEAGDDLMFVPTWHEPTTLLIAGASLALGLGLTFLSSHLNKPESANQAATDQERSFTFAGAQSRYTPGGRVPLLYGRRRIGLDLGAGVQNIRYASTFIDTALTGINRTRTVLEHFQGRDPTVRWRRLTAVFRVSISGTGGDIKPEPGQRIRLAPGTSQERTKKGEFRLVTVEYKVNGQVDIGMVAYGGVEPPRFVGAEITFLNDFEFNATSENAMIDVLGVGPQGPIGGLYPETIELNGQPIGNFPEIDVDVRLGDDPQLRITNIEDAGLSVGVGQEIVVTPVIAYTTTAAIDRFRLNIDFNNGLIKFTNEGDTQPNRVTIEYRYQRNAGGFIGWRQVTFVAKSLAPVRAAIERTVEHRDFYTIEVRLVQAEQDDPGKGRFTPTLTSVTEITTRQVSYDGFSLVYLRNIPADRVEGQLPNITIVADGMRCRVASFTSTPVFTNNPAWCVMDMLTRIFQAPDASIDLAGFQAYAALCDTLVPSISSRDGTAAGLERDSLPTIDPLDDIGGSQRKHTLSYLVEAKTREQTIIQEMMEGSRTELIREAGLWTPKPLLDEPTPHPMLTMGNVSNVRVRYTKDINKINVIDFSYNDRENNYERATESYPVLNEQPTVRRKIETDLRSIDNHNEAVAAAQFELKQLQGPMRSLTFQTNLEGFRLQVFDLIDFAHELPGWGVSGRCANNPGNSPTLVYLDRPVNIDGMKQYDLYLRFPNDVTEVRNVPLLTTGTYTSLPVTTPFSQTPSGDTTLFSVGERSGGPPPVVPFRIMQAPEYDEATGRMLVQAMWHNTALYDDDPPTAPPPVTILPNFQGLPPEILEVNATEFNRYDTTGSRIATVWLSWTIDVLEVGESPYRGALIYRRGVGTANTVGSMRLGSTQLGTLILPDELIALTDYEQIAEVRDGAKQYDDQKVFPGATYQYKIVPVSTRGVWAPTRAGYLVHHVTATDQIDDGSRPETPQGLRLVGATIGVVGAFEEDAMESDAFVTDTSGVSGTTFTGPDVIFEWERPRNEGAVESTRIVNEWLVQIWGTSGTNNLAYRLYPGLQDPEVLVRQPRFEFVQGLNAEAASAVFGGEPIRKMTILVWARNQLQNLSFLPAQLTVDNEAPNMAAIALTTTPKRDGIIVDWQQFIPPRDLAGYRIVIDDRTPPRQSGAIVDTTIAPGNTAYEASGLFGVEHAVQVTPLDTFGPGIPTPVALETPLVEKSAFQADDTSITIGKTETSILSLNVNVSQDVGAVLVLGKAVLVVAGGIQSELRIREDSVTGNILDRVIITRNVGEDTQTESVTLTGLFEPTTTEVKTFHLTGQVDPASTGTTTDYVWNRLTVMYVLTEQ